ncbi:DJ-1/PfpI family protein [Cupriavidus sp. CuC1]|uniref:DJ-1/PfpI family protein n=1 Tax=Cupriavidus sp. CuC1 TaxID=3373131 RepID=UPI0037D198BA
MRAAVVLYPHVEPIDLAVVGTLSMAKRVTDKLSYFTVSENGGQVELQNGLRVETDFSFADAPVADVVVVTGGPGWRKELENTKMHAFLKQRHARGEVISSVCTGAMILGASGLLDGKRATTKAPVADPEECPITTMERLYSTTDAVEALVVDEGDIVTGGGVTLGIDTTLYLLERYLGPEVCSETARIMEYGAALRANRSRLPTLKAEILAT